MKQPTMGELRKMEIEEMSAEQLQRFIKLSRRSGIKTMNGYIADFEATRKPGRFAFVKEDDEDES